MNLKNILTQILVNLDKKYEELTPPAKEKFDLWEKVLSKESINLEEFKQFIQSENERLIKQIIDRDLVSKSEKDIRLKAELSYGRFILSVLESPEVAKKHLEAQLKKEYNIK